MVSSIGRLLNLVQIKAQIPLNLYQCFGAMICREQMATYGQRTWLKVLRWLFDLMRIHIDTVF